MESHFPIPSGHQSKLARQRLVEDLGNLVSDAELLLKATAGDMSEKAGELRQRLSASIEQAKLTAGEFRRRGIAAAKKADVVVRDHPYEALLTALTIGVVVGIFMSHQRSSN